MRLITGDECGFLKECIPELSRSNTKEESSPPPGVPVPVSSDNQGCLRVSPSDNDPGRRRRRRRTGIVDLAWVDSNHDTAFASLRMDGVVQVWERSSHTDRDYGRYHDRTVGPWTNRNIFAPDPTRDVEPTIRPWTKPLSLFALGDSKTKSDRLCACNALGDVVVMNCNDDNDNDDDEQSAILGRFSTVATSQQEQHNKFGNAYITATGLDRRHHRVAVGGQERETTLWDLETSKQVWKAKNLSADPQTLLPPQVWPSAISFLEQTDPSIGSNIMAVGSAHCEVRIYDVRQDTIQRRPISYTPNSLLEHRVTTLCLVDTFHVVVGDSTGDLHTLDLRTLGKQKKDTTISTWGRYVGPVGSIRGLVQHASLPTLATVGLDRMLRLYDTQSRKQLYCMYLRQRLNCVLFGEETSWLDSDHARNVDGDIDEEDKVSDYEDSDKEESSSRQQPKSLPETKTNDVQSSEDEIVDLDEEESSEDSDEDSAVVDNVVASVSRKKQKTR